MKQQFHSPGVATGEFQHRAAELSFGAMRRRFAAVVTLFLLTGCGESFIAIEPVITPANAVHVPGLGGHYESHERYRGTSARASDKDGKDVSFDIFRTPRYAGTDDPYYSVKIYMDNGSQILTEDLLLTPLYGSTYLAQAPISPEQAKKLRSSFDNSRLRAERYYFLYFLYIFDTTYQGKFVYLESMREHGYRILSLLGEIYGVEVITALQIGMFGGNRHFIMGKPDAMLKLLSEAPHLESERFARFRKSGAVGGE